MGSQVMPAIDTTGGGDRAGVHGWHLRLPGITEALGVDVCARPTGGIQSRWSVVSGCVYERKEIASDPTGFRGDHREHGIGGDGRIDGASTRYQ
jgi:hypothetical protein